MNSQQHEEAELKLEAYKAAITACRPGTTVNDIKTEAERLWAWMMGNTEQAK